MLLTFEGPPVTTVSVLAASLFVYIKIITISHTAMPVCSYILHIILINLHMSISISLTVVKTYPNNRDKLSHIIYSIYL